MIVDESIAFLVILVAMLIRTLTGFGSALISIPFLSILFGAKFAIPFIMLYECLIDLMILTREGGGARSELNRARPLLLAGLVGIPLGTEVLILSSEGILRIMVGAALILFSLLLLRNVSLMLKTERTNFALAGLMGGFLCGSIGMPGPPMALFLSSQGIEKVAFRRIMVIFLTIVDFLTFSYFLWIGLITADMLLQSLRLLPALILGFLLGNFAFVKFDEAYFRKLILGMVITAGTVLIISTL